MKLLIIVFAISLVALVGCSAEFANCKVLKVEKGMESGFLSGSSTCWFYIAERISDKKIISGRSYQLLSVGEVISIRTGENVSHNILHIEKIRF